MSSRDSARAALVALLGIVALGVAAATLDATTVFGDLATGPGAGTAGGGGGAPPLPTPSGPPDVAPLLPKVVGQILLLGLLVAGTVLGATYALRYWRTTLVLLLAVAGTIGVFALFQPAADLSDGAALPFQPAGPAGAEAGGAAVPVPLSDLVAAVVLVGLVVVAIVVLRPTRRAGEFDSDSERVEADAETTAAIGRAAGRAADRIDAEPGPTNEVYRAWQEMTGLLEVANADTTTPGQFADAAIAAGLGREDVRDLTRLFEDVRYGATPPSADYEARAITVLRRIEDRYTEEDA